MYIVDTYMLGIQFDEIKLFLYKMYKKLYKLFNCINIPCLNRVDQFRLDEWWMVDAFSKTEHGFNEITKENLFLYSAFVVLWFC